MTVATAGFIATFGVWLFYGSLVVWFFVGIHALRLRLQGKSWQAVSKEINDLYFTDSKSER